MEPFGAEECHSSESGWTMYIGSPVDDGSHSDDDDGGEKNDDDDDDDSQAHPQDDDESGDSMASDASSGPSHHHGFREYDKNKYCLEKKANKTQHKQTERKKVEKKGILFVETKDKAPVQGCGKVRKNYSVGKRK